MSVLHFESDYMEGCSPLILEKLSKINLEKNPGYGSDDYCASAKEKIRRACGKPDASVFFLVGGTQTNSTVIASVLKPWQGVVSADTGHIAVHEAGAVEATGHKVLTVKSHDGKISAADVDSYLGTFFSDDNREHMVEPGMVYISHPTEYGTLYSKDELKALSEVCRKYEVPLFLDGARLGYGLAADPEVTLKEIAEYCDIFYIGGTKCGAMFGEAVVFTKPELISHSVTLIKQHGALLAKGWLLGVQYDVLFTDDLYLKITKNAIDQAMYMKAEMKKLGVQFFNDSVTNQQFFVFENSVLKKISEKAGYSFWEKYDDTHTVIRFATSWATTKEQVDTLIAIVKEAAE